MLAVPVGGGLIDITGAHQLVVSRSAILAWPERSSSERTKPKSRIGSVYLMVEHLSEPLQNGRAITSCREFARYVVAHDLRASDIPSMTGRQPTQCAALASSARLSRRPM
jgi:hypothetical protein